MKKYLTALLVTSLLGYSATTIAASTDGFYLGTGAGISNLEEADDGDDDNVEKGFRDVAWKIFAGYQINKYVSVEANYTDYGTMEAREDGTDYALDSDITSYGLSVIGAIPIMRDLSITGRLGYAKWDADSEYNTGETESFDDYDINFGLGIKYDIHGFMSVRGDWVRQKTDGADIDTFTASAAYHF